MNEYNAIRTIAQTLISARDGDLTSEEIRRCVASAVTHFPSFSPESVESLVRDLEANYQTVIGAERELVGKDEGWSPWLPERKGQLEWPYWRRYEQLLRNGPMNDDVRQRLDDSTDRVLGLMGDPRRVGSWDRRGLVVGLVQSGKTSHYVGLINKAADAGYKIIVVLTGFTESLRVQTQIRLDEGFLGYSFVPGRRAGDVQTVRTGVGIIAPGKSPGSVTTRSHDFKQGVAKNFGIQVDGKEILFVIKKNVGVLKNLLNWIKSFGNATDSNGRRFVKDVPLLVIDDESDVGSVDTRKIGTVDDELDPEHKPTKINKRIRQLLGLFDQSSYVGYTATPFANVLIHDGARTSKLGDDLFPRSFIVSLPTPTDHVGPSMVFGRELDDGTHEDGLPIFREIESAEADSDAAWIPQVHKKTCRPVWDGRTEVPPSLRKAMLSFMLVCAARRVRRTGTKHNSMLVHVTRFVDVQAQVGTQVRKELKGVVDRLRTGVDSAPLLDELRKLWVQDFAETTRRVSERDGAMFQHRVHTWGELEPELLRAVAAIQVREINGEAAEVLDYDQHKEDGLNVIAIGGDKLSRGLTLDGLSVSYFLRCSRMYDTLMQMGRWFGYRHGYLDLCRLFTTDDLAGWFRHIAYATEELRGEFDRMANSGGTPKDFGLRVRSHSDLIVTSQVKMRHGDTIQITFSGDILETINFNRQPDIVNRNWEAGRVLLAGLEAAGTRVDFPKPTGALWTGASPDLIRLFLTQYAEHPSASKVRTQLLNQYVEEEVRQGRLTSWTVLLSAGGSMLSRSLGPVTFPLAERAWHTSVTIKKEDSDDVKAQKAQAMQREIEAMQARGVYKIRRLVSPADEKVDLSEEAIASAYQETLDTWKKDTKGRRRPKDPAGRFLRARRPATNGLLILYPLHPGEGKTESGDTPVLAFAISFPSVSGASTVTYTVNNVYQREEQEYL